MNRKALAWLALFLSALMPLLVVALLPHTYFYYDVNLFWSRGALWKENWREIYWLCETCDYTFVGTAITAGFMSLFLPLGPDAGAQAFRLFLALFDGANTLLIFYLLRHFHAPRPHWLAAAISVSLGAWVGSAFWGQIEGFTQFLILLVITLVVRKNSTPRSRRYYAGYLIVLGALLAVLLMTKQLGVFSVVALLILIGADTLFYSRGWGDVARYSLVGMGTLLLTIAVVDVSMHIPEGYLSHLQYVFATGGSHTGAHYLSMNGFNLWMLLGKPMATEAQIPLFGASRLFSPHYLGRVIFILVAGVCALPLTHLFQGRPLVGIGANMKPQEIGRFILYLAIANLAFNLFLTGTHERYLYHFFPYVIIAWYALAYEGPAPSGKFTAAMLGLSNLYGLFVLAIMNNFERYSTLPHIVMGLVGLCAFIYIAWFFLRLEMRERIFPQTEAHIAL